MVDDSKIKCSVCYRRGSIPGENDTYDQFAGRPTKTSGTWNDLDKRATQNLQQARYTPTKFQ